jgi:3-hydroxyisobutyrate dehydrogenase-like beta-hydroxyacid dehydrogenase
LTTGATGATAGGAALPRLGFIGLGAMGGRMSRRLLKAGYPLIGYDTNPERLAACVEAGANAARDAREVVREAEIVLTSLVGPVYIKVAGESLLPAARAESDC